VKLPEISGQLDTVGWATGRASAFEKFGFILLVVMT